MNLNDSFGESGSPDGLIQKYGLTADHVIKASREALAAKAAK